MTVIKLMKKTPLTATQKTNIAKAVGDFVVHPKGSAIINAKGKIKVDALGTAKVPKNSIRDGRIKRNYKPNWSTMTKISGYKSSAVNRRPTKRRRRR
jgi:hypothetical protein